MADREAPTAENESSRSHAEKELDAIALEEVRRRREEEERAFEEECAARDTERAEARRRFSERMTEVDAAERRLLDARAVFRAALLDREDVRAYLAWRCAEIDVYDAQDSANAAARAAGRTVTQFRPPSGESFAELVRLVLEEEVVRRR